MANVLWVVFQVFCLLRIGLAFNCSVPPVYVDIHKRVVHGTDVFQYGAFTGVGTPGQNQSLFPSLRQNETSVADTTFCTSSSLADCVDATHGNFETDDSSTWASVNDYTSHDLTPIVNDSFFGKDVFHFYTHYFTNDAASDTPVSDFIVEVATNGSVNPGILGLGQSSTILQKLFADNLVAGQTFGLYVGSGMDRAGGVINGSVTLGGYDAGRFEGEVHNYTMDLSSPDALKVTVQDIVINDPTGLVRNVSLFDSSRFSNLAGKSPSFDASITTDYYPMSFPYEVTENFRSTLAASNSDSPDGSLQLTKPFNGTMSIVLSDGFTVTIPNDVMYNASGLSPVAARDQNSTDPYYLSLSWLSQVYLMVNYDDYSFHLAQAIVENEFVMPTTFCPKTTPIAYTSPPQSPFTKEGMVGAVVGGIMGGIALLIGAWCLFVFWKRKKMAEQFELEAQKRKSKMVSDDEISSEDGAGAAKGLGEKMQKLAFWKG